MAFKKEFLQKVAALLKLDAAKLEQAAASQTEEDIAVPEDITVLTTEELTTRDAAKITEGKREGEAIGETKGKEIAVKELKKNFGVEFEGKDLTKLVEKVKTELGKGDEGLKLQVDQLRKTVTEKEQEIETVKSTAAQAQFDASLLASLPANRKSASDGGLTDAEYLAMIKQNLEFIDSEGQKVVKRGGKIVLAEKTQTPAPINDVINSFLNERKWVVDADPGGRGGGGKPGGNSKPTKISEAAKQWQADGKPLNAEFQAHVNVLAAENKDFEFDTIE